MFKSEAGRRDAEAKAEVGVRASFVISLPSRCILLPHSLSVLWTKADLQLGSSKVKWAFWSW